MKSKSASRAALRVANVRCSKSSVFSDAKKASASAFYKAVKYR